ncbi:hypothetical protein [Teichococcus aestuarii]|uniref:hypothetical protein n=1 Tax=Teichococcus aestuarii TaxID=568898 RepID=UPI0036232B56
MGRAAGDGAVRRGAAHGDQRLPEPGQHDAGGGAVARALRRGDAPAASGQRADSYAGLGADARRSVDLRAEWSRRETLATSAETAGAKLAYTQTVLGRFSEIANGMAEAAGSALGTLGPDRAMVAQNARAALAEVAGLLGERYQGEALFGGSDPTGSPIVNPGEIQQTGLYAGTRAAMARLGQDDAAAVLAETRALAASDAPGITPFSAHASAAARGEIDDPRPGVTLGEGVRSSSGSTPTAMPRVPAPARTAPVPGRATCCTG